MPAPRRMLTLLGILAVMGAWGETLAQSNPVARVKPNDNRHASGTLRNDTLAIALEARLAMWHPNGDDKPGARIAAFAESEGAARIPGPLLRVRAGTSARVTVANHLPDTLVMHGLHSRGARIATDTMPLTLSPGERREVTFRLDAPGTYYYWGTTTSRRLDFRTLEDAQLTGAIVVDVNDDAPPAPDRILVIGMWTDTVHRSGVHRKRVLGVINGRSWPNTERLTHSVGDSVRWRVINASGDLHPMHLHGFYFDVNSRGDGRTDTPAAPGARRLAVTESMNSGSTMAITWTPERAGNWLFHCHIPEHIEPRGPLGMPSVAGPHASHATHGMSGLVMGITVRAPAVRTAAARAPVAAERRLRLLVRPRTGSTNEAPQYEYVVHERGVEPRTGARGDAATVLDIVRGQPVRITIVNRLPEPTAVHWHGIELESYYDGVPGFSGAGARVTPLISASDSFVVRFTPPRSGTFIFHTHADETRQHFAGLAGALVVSEPDRPRDARRDLPLVLSEIRTAAGAAPRTVVNGRADAPPLELTLGSTYRLRFIQMSVARSALRVELLVDSTVTTWRPVAKDGAALPAAERVPVTARLRFGVGETYDFEFTPTVAGPMRMEIRQGLVWPRPALLMATQSIIVRP